jgi:surface protein|tara:strand:+ start:1133 stop:2143 length:1011 start_codon:yes stop_codon:yes gene_type:complete
MATYTSLEMNGSGSLGAALTGTQVFTITNPLNYLNDYQTGYLTLEGNSTANQNLPTTTYLTGTFSNFTGIDEDGLVYINEATHWSISIAGSGGEFTFVPTSNIAQDSYYIKSTGLFSLSVVTSVYTFTTKAELQTAVNLWISDNTAALATYGEINTWNVSAITDMDQLFQNKTTFNSDISNWDVSNVTTMRNMFDGATSFDQPIGGWNISSVNATWFMFRGATSFNQPINNWDMSSVQGMLFMFENADSFQQPLNLWEMNALQGTFSQGFMGTTGDAGAITYTGYDALLIGWAANASIKTGITISFGDSTFTATALAARNILVNDKGWIITDGGQV